MLQWATTLISILCTAFRALNIGYQSHTYVVSALCYVIFIWTEPELHIKTLNAFYLLFALVGAFRFSQKIS